MLPIERNYRNLIDRVLTEGEVVPSRNGEGTTELFGVMFQHHMMLGFPLISGRRMYPGPVLGELKAFLSGATHVDEFKQWGCNYWDEFADADGNLGPIYGAQWRHWKRPSPEPYGYVDQIGKLLKQLAQAPHSRRHVVSCWNPGAQHEMSLPPCHYAFQVHISPDGRLDLLVNQRSLDLMVGFPSDLVLYGALMHLLCKETGTYPGQLTFMLGSVHIYKSHLDNAKTYLDRGFIPGKPHVNFKGYGIFDFDPRDVILQLPPGSNPPPLKFELHV